MAVVAIRGGRNQYRLICLRTWVWALENLEIRLSTIRRHCYQYDIIVAVIVDVPYIHALAEWVGRDLDDISTPLMGIHVTLAPEHSQVRWADECLTDESYILLEVNNIRHLIAIDICYLYLLTVCSLEDTLSLGVSNASCDEYVLSVGEASRTVIEHRCEVETHAT